MRSILIEVDGIGYAPVVLESIYFNQSILREPVSVVRDIAILKYET